MPLATVPEHIRVPVIGEHRTIGLELQAVDQDTQPSMATVSFAANVIVRASCTAGGVKVSASGNESARKSGHANEVSPLDEAIFIMTEPKDGFGVRLTKAATTAERELRHGLQAKGCSPKAASRAIGNERVYGANRRTSISLRHAEVAVYVARCANGDRQVTFKGQASNRIAHNDLPKQFLGKGEEGRTGLEEYAGGYVPDDADKLVAPSKLRSLNIKVRKNSLIKIAKAKKAGVQNPC